MDEELKAAGWISEPVVEGAESELGTVTPPACEERRHPREAAAQGCLAGAEAVTVVGGRPQHHG